VVIQINSEELIIDVEFEVKLRKLLIPLIYIGGGFGVII